MNGIIIGVAVVVLAITVALYIKTKPLNIKVKYKDGMDEIIQAHEGEWYDLRTAEDIYMNEGEYRLIPLGVSMQLPKGYEAHVVPRSSTFKRYRVIMTNSVGIIDSAYCGDGDEWHFPVYSTETTIIPKNERICQFRIVKTQPYAVIEKVKHLGNKNRGGLGSTGRK